MPLFASYTVEICLTTEEKLTTFMPCPSLRVIYWKFALQLRKSLQLSGRAPLCELYFGNLPYNLGKAYNFRAVPLFASYILEICLTTEENLQLTTIDVLFLLRHSVSRLYSDYHVLCLLFKSHEQPAITISIFYGSKHFLHLCHMP